MKLRNITAASISWLGLNLGACATDVAETDVDFTGGEDTSEVAPIIASLELSDGRSVTFQEAEPGFVVVSQRGPIGSAMLYNREDTRELGIVGLYEQLAGEPAPQTLLDAAARAKNMSSPHDGDAAAREMSFEAVAPRQLALSSVVDEAQVAVSQQALSNGISTETFRQTFCTNNWDEQFRHWLNVTGTGSITVQESHGMTGAAMAVRGTVHWVVKTRPWYTWRNVRDVDLPEGWYEEAEAGGGDIDNDFRTTVSEADGDTYNMCTQWY